VSGDFVYVADRLAGLQVVDVSDPTTPFIAAVCDSGSDVRGVAVVGDYALLADVGTGLLSLDVSDPTAPFYVGGVGVRDGGYDVVVSGDRAFMTLGVWGLSVLDVSDPAAPVQIDETMTGGWAYGLAVTDDYAYVGDHDGGLAVFEHSHRRYDLNNNVIFSHPIEDSDINIISARLTTTQTDNIVWNISADGGSSWDFVVPDGSIHEFTHPGTLLVWRSTHLYNSAQVNPQCFDMSLEYFKDETGVHDGEPPTVLALRQNAPNPFRGGTTVGYDIPRDGVSVALEVYDVSGRLVCVLADGPQSAGSNLATWDGRNEQGSAVASGVYYCRMRSEDFEESIKLLLLR
jgi:hypothetical protein